MTRAKRAAKWAAVLLAVVALGRGAMAFRHGAYGADAVMHPPRVAVQRPQDGSEASRLTDVTFPSTLAPDVILHGWYLPSANGAAVVLVHGYGGNRLAVWPEARALAARGYGILLFDLQAHGESGGEESTLGDKERGNVAGALDYLAQRPDPPRRLGVFAFSMGGWAAVAEAAKDTRVRALALAGVTSSFEAQARGWNPFRLAYLAGQSWEFEKRGVDLGQTHPVDFIFAFAPRPVIFILGTKDTAVPSAWSLALYAAAGDPKEVMTVEGAEHGRYFETQGPRYTHKVVAFFDRTLAPSR